MTSNVITAVASPWSTVRAGDVVALTRLPHMGPVGYVFDVVGDVVRVWHPTATDSDVDGLTPFQRAELTMIHRPDAFLSMRYAGTRSEKPYVFVCADTRARVLDAERIFTNAGDYVIVESRLEREVSTDTTTEDADHDGDAG